LTLLAARAATTIVDAKDRHIRRKRTVEGSSLLISSACSDETSALLGGGVDEAIVTGTQKM
jgi:hypothetical protein